VQAPILHLKPSPQRKTGRSRLLTIQMLVSSDRLWPTFARCIDPMLTFVARYGLTESEPSQLVASWMN
jgi:hypothetical protein